MCPGNPTCPLLDYGMWRPGCAPLPLPSSPWNPCEGITTDLFISCCWGGAYEGLSWTIKSRDWAMLPSLLPFSLLSPELA